MQEPLLSARAFIIVVASAIVAVLALPLGGPIGSVLAGLAVATGLHTLIGK
jgi:hypothetical protein